jgi:hypothetical protein
MRQQLPQLTAVDAAFRADEQQQRPFALQLAFRAYRRERALRDAEQLRTAAQGIVIGCHAQRIGAFTVRLYARHAHHALRRTCRRRAGLAQVRTSTAAIGVSCGCASCGIQAYGIR